MRQALLLFLLSFFAVIISAQDCQLSIQGKVYDFHDGKVLSGARISIPKIGTELFTNQDGTFLIKNLCAGKYVLQVSHPKCNDLEQTIQLTKNQTLDFKLEHHIIELEEANAEANAQTKISTTERIDYLTESKIEAFGNTNLALALQEVNGVSSLKTGNNIVKPVINGLHSSRLLILQNGVRIQDQEWGAEHAPNVDINAAQQINIVKGAQSLAYGSDAIGGTILIKPNRLPKKDSLFGKTIVSVQTNGRGANVTSQLTKTYQNGWYGNLQATYNRLGDFESADYVLSNTGIQKTAVNAILGYESFRRDFSINYSYFENELGILSASHIGNISDLVDAINQPEPLVIDDFTYSIDEPRQQVSHHLLKVSFSQRFAGLGQLHAQYDFQKNRRLEFDRRLGDRRNLQAIDLDLTTHSFSLDFDWDKNLKRQYKTGLLFRYQENFPDPITGVRRLIPDYERVEIGAYAITNWKLGQKTNLDAAVRYDFQQTNAQKFYLKSRWEERGYDNDFASIVVEDLATQLLTNPIMEFHNFSAALGLKKEFNPYAKLFVNYKFAMRAPNPSELFSDGLHHSAARIELGDLRIIQEKANRFSVTYAHSNKKLDWQIESFVNYIQDFIYLTPTGIQQSIRGAFPVWEYEQDAALLMGVDFDFSYQFNTKWSYLNQSSFLLGRNLDREEALIDMPPFNTTNSIQYQNPRWMNFTSQINSQFVARQNNFPDYNFQQFLPGQNQTALVDVSTPPDAYHLFHFSAQISKKIFKQSTLQIGLRIENLLNQEYRDYLNRLRFFADDLGRNIILQLKINY